jgi:polyphosphate kinase
MEEEVYKEGCTQNREISWLRFDDRCLNEAKDRTVPLLERLKFVSIFTSNLEEFFRVRVGSLYDMEKVKYDEIDKKSGLTAKGQLDLIYPMAKRELKKRDKVYHELRQEMADAGIYDLDIEQCNKEEIRYLRKYYRKRVDPLLTAQVVDAHHPFPNLLTGRTYIAAVLRAHHKHEYAFVMVPPSLDDIIILPEEDRLAFVHVGEVIRHNIDQLYPDAEVLETLKFKLARSAYIDADDEAFDDITDYRKKMMKVLKERRKMNVTSITFSNQPSAELKNYLVGNLKLKPQMVNYSQAPFSLKYAFRLPKFLNDEQKQKFLYPPYEPKMTPELDYKKSIFDQLLKKDVLLSYPYDSMGPFLNLVKEAANDDSVVAIKITIYRLANHARLVEYLCQAAENGKEVDVLIELKARFDEQNNIDYSEILEESGCNVFYGFEHYKVHSKLCLITRSRDEKIENVALVATGNFNENTAKQYTDLALMTSRASITRDAVDFFQNMMIGKLDGHYRTLWVAPISLKSNILASIEREIEKGPEGYIFIKINGFTDEDIIKALIRASQAGVYVDMVIRGISCLLPGVPGKTDNIHIRSIVGRYLEHSRIYIFGRGAGEIRKRIHEFVDLYLADNVKARVMNKKGRYVKVKRNDGEKAVSVQDEMMALTKGTTRASNAHRGKAQAVVFQTTLSKKEIISGKEKKSATDKKKKTEG